jgi:hypothetical protein
MAMTVRTEPRIDGRTAADALEQRLAAGGSLLELESATPLQPGEALHAGIEAQCSWYGPADVTYTHQHLLVFGSTPWLTLSAATSAIGNHRRHRSANALAAPQWRPLGHTHILLTNHQLLLRIGDDFQALPLATINALEQPPDPRGLNVHFTDGTTLALHGDWTRYLHIALTTCLTGSRKTTPRVECRWATASVGRCSMASTTAR